MPMGCSRLTRSASSGTTTTSPRSISPTQSRRSSGDHERRSLRTDRHGTHIAEEQMADNTLSILRPSVNNLSARIFVRAAGLDFDERDVWGKKEEPAFMQKDP